MDIPGSNCTLEFLNLHLKPGFLNLPLKLGRGIAHCILIKNKRRAYKIS